MPSKLIRSQQSPYERSRLIPLPRFRQRTLRLLLLPFTAAFFLSGVVHAQSDATAVQPLGISAFGGATGTWTNISGGRNLGITAGGDVAFLSFRRIRPVIEVRGTYAVHKGQVDAQKDVLGGLRLEHQIGAFRPYVNFLLGRGAIDFENGGYLNGGYLYLRTVSLVYSPGLGVEYDVTHHWSAKADFQYQHWGTPAVPSGVVNPRVLTAGAVYRFDFNHHYKEGRVHSRFVP